MKKKIIGLIAVLVLSVGMMTGCASLDRAITDVKSEVGNGLNRTITVKLLLSIRARLIFRNAKVDM